MSDLDDFFRGRGRGRPKTSRFRGIEVEVKALISVLSGSPGSGPTPRHVHWLTGTPDPTHSVFKPFIFVEGAEGSPFCVSPDVTNDPAKDTSRTPFRRMITMPLGYLHHLDPFLVECPHVDPLDCLFTGEEIGSSRQDSTESESREFKSASSSQWAEVAAGAEEGSVPAGPKPLLTHVLFKGIRLSAESVETPTRSHGVGSSRFQGPLLDRSFEASKSVCCLSPEAEQRPSTARLIRRDLVRFSRFPLSPTVYRMMSEFYPTNGCQSLRPQSPQPLVSSQVEAAQSQCKKRRRHSCLPPLCRKRSVTIPVDLAKPRFARKVDRSHRLWELHSRALASGSFPLETMRSMETTCVNEIKENQASAGDADLKDLFKDLVLSEMKFYE
ncbi:unnamed protein product [Cyprideis torosa]|uniref:Uncharacterized protein n=1 Tax=Cyprideis torosa TaxID=163714 RepID=A0A7R8ZIJ0_9CRUS|nr:unnamed protein product [Cyprideis torosa]CAG0880058.1 unnamed protein product [Cyprideis torosa]